MGLKTTERERERVESSGWRPSIKCCCWEDEFFLEASGSLLEQLRSKAQIDFKVDRPMFGWSQVRAAWNFNRFGANQKVTPYEKQRRRSTMGTWWLLESQSWHGANPPCRKATRGGPKPSF